MRLYWLLPITLVTRLVAQQPTSIRFHVVKDNLPVTTLNRDDFILLIDGAPRKITEFWGAQSPRPKSPVELIFLLDSSAPSNPSDPETLLLNADRIADLIQSPRQEIRAAIYGYASGLKRFCAPTRDPQVLKSALDGATGVAFLQQHEIRRNPDDGLARTNPTPLPESGASPADSSIPSPGNRVPGSRLGMMSWNEALLVLAKDVVRSPSSAARIVIPILNGLPQPSWDPKEVLETYQQLGLMLYPRISMHQWIRREEWDLTHGRPEPLRAPVIAGLNWKKMTKAEKLAWLDQENSLVERYEMMGEQTGGRAFAGSPFYGAAAGMLETEIPSIYTAEIPTLPGNHKIEIRLRDQNLGKVIGGTRTTQGAPIHGPSA